MTRRLLAVVGLLAAVACTTDRPSPSSEPAPSEPTASTRSPGVIGDPGSPVSLRPPDRPFDAADILAAMRDSPRPGGVPDELETDAVAAAVADAIWTLQGDAWETITAAGSCGAGTCTLELAGGHPGAAGEDVWVLDVTPDGAVEVVTADLHAVPVEVVRGLDAWAREIDTAGRLDGLLLTSARWQAPPEETRFVLAYRSGDEEESCVLDVELDVADGTLTELRSTGC